MANTANKTDAANTASTAARAKAASAASTANTTPKAPRAPRAAQQPIAANAAKSGKLRITYVKSVIGYSQRQRDTITSLGLRRLHQSVEHTDTPEIRGMVNKVSHLVRVEEVTE